MLRTRGPGGEIFFLLLCFSSACSGASATLRGEVEGGSGGGSASGGGISNGASGGGSAQQDATGMTMEEAGPSGSSGATSGDAEPLDAPLVSEASSDGSGDGQGSMPDAAPAQVLCTTGTTMSTQCQLPQMCCISSPSFPFGTTTATCQGATATCSGTPIRCSSAADCSGGSVCCGTQTTSALGTTSYSMVECQPTCTTSAGSTRYRFCDPNTGECPTGTTCQSSTTLTGYYVCR
jgi:hypothetical protein